MTHLLNWDVRSQRHWSPLYFMNLERYDPEPIPPIEVSAHAVFDDDQAAQHFEKRVREILEELA